MGRRALGLLGWGLGTAVALAVPASVAAAEPPTRDCGWTTKLSGDQINALYPDQAAKYWNGLLPIPPGGHIEIKGRYPHARYLSFHTYNRLLPIDAVADVEIAPDAGSSNPFLKGADRTTANRSYTLRVVEAPPPAGGRAPNTLYAGANGSSSSSVLFTIRIYTPDAGRDETGGVGLPRITLVSGSGQRAALPECPTLGLPNVGQTEALAALGLAGPLPRLALGGLDPPRFHKHFSAARSYAIAIGEGEGRGESALDEIAAALPSAGLGENVHNKYVFAVTNRTFGEVIVLRGKAPTFPYTNDGRAIMEDGQTRYWSWCTDSIYTQYYACATDEQTPLDADRRYTVAISTAGSRPANARESCGVVWLPHGPDVHQLAILRNMLPRDDFPNSIQKVPSDGAEAGVMGDYYPRGSYLATKADFERRGCTPPEFPAARSGCLRRTLKVSERGIGPVALKRTRKQLERAAGRPSKRTSDSWRWCVSGGGKVSVAFSKGRSVMVASTAPRHRAGKLAAGRSAGRMRSAHPRRLALGRGVYRSQRRGRLVIATRRTKIRVVGVLANAAKTDAKAVRSYLKRTGL